MPQDAINTYYIFDQTKQNSSDKLYLIGNPFSATWRERTMPPQVAYIWDTMRRGNIIVKNAVANSNGTITITNNTV